MEAAALLISLDTQWNYSATGMRIGLNYAGVEAMVRLHDMKMDSETFSKIQILERELIVIGQEKNAKQN